MLHLMSQTPECLSLVKTVVKRRKNQRASLIWTYLLLCFPKGVGVYKGGASAQAGSVPVASGKITAAKHPFKSLRWGLLLFFCKYLHVDSPNILMFFQGYFNYRNPRHPTGQGDIHVWNCVTAPP